MKIPEIYYNPKTKDKYGIRPLVAFVGNKKDKVLSRGRAVTLNKAKDGCKGGKGCNAMFIGEVSAKTGENCWKIMEMIVEKYVSQCEFCNLCGYALEEC